jgi:hypothetical protein
MRARGRRTQRLARYPACASARPQLSLALVGRGGLLGLQGPRRLVVLHGDGSVFASSAIPRDHGHAEGIWSALALAPHARAVAFAAAPNQTSGYVTQTVYALDAGAHAAAPVLRERIDVPGCRGPGATLQWHGRWLLYGAVDGSLFAIDSRGSHRAIALTGLVRHLLGAGGQFSAYWSGAPPQG